MKWLIARWAVNAGGLMIVGYLFDGIRFDGFGWVLAAAAILGVLNTMLRPVLLVLTLPLTVVSLGFFALVINAFMLKMTGWLLSGFQVQGFWTSLGAAVVLSLISLGVNHLIGRGQISVTKRPKDDDDVIPLNRGSDGTWE
jgi:putative membrane protein